MVFRPICLANVWYEWAAPSRKSKLRKVWPGESTFQKLYVCPIKYTYVIRRLNYSYYVYNSSRGIGPRRMDRTMSSSSDTNQGSNSASGNNVTNGLHQSQPYSSQQPSRKANGVSAPAPLLGMAPQNLVSHPPPNSHTNHHQTSNHSSLQNPNLSNGRYYGNSYAQNVSHISDNYYYSTRPYRGADSR